MDRKPFSAKRRAGGSATETQINTGNNDEHIP